MKSHRKEKVGTPNRWGTCIETNAPQKLDKPIYLPERLFAEVPTLLTKNKKGGIKLKKYKVSFNLTEKETIINSPYTGKPYKKSRTRRNWIDLTEIIEAPSLPEALIQSKIFAKIQEWQLVSVEELQ